MKKVLVLLLALTMVFALAACGQSVRPVRCARSHCRTRSSGGRARPD